MAEGERLQHQTWSKDHYHISTDAALLPVAKINQAFASSDVYWALPMPEAVLRETLQRSLCFGLYDMHVKKGAPDEVDAGDAIESREKEDMELVGFARCVTDYTTFVYLTDVYFWPAHQGRGLGKWLIMCVQEVIEWMPYLRRSMLFTSGWERLVPMYRALMGMELIGSADGAGAVGAAVMQRKGEGFPKDL